MNAGISVFFGLFFLLTEILTGGEIHGTVTTAEGIPLVHATVQLEGSPRGTITDESGTYHLPDLREGAYVLTVSMLGYRTERHMVIIDTEDRIATVDVTLTDVPIDLGEVVVTANKREERLESVPAAVTSVSAVRLDDMRIQQRSDLSSLAPNLLVAQTGSHLTDLINIRGMFPSTPFGATTLFYYDGVPIYGYGMNPVHLYDIERIEILRGPQGILYGRNALAGVIHVVSPKPTNRSRLNLEAEYGDYGVTRFLLGASAPLQPDLFAHISGFYSGYDGYSTNTFLDRSAGDGTGYGGTAKLRYFPTASFDAELFAHAEYLDESIWPYASSPAEALANPYTFHNDVDSRIRKLNTLAALKLHGRIPGVDLHFTGTYQGVTDMFWRYDADFSPADIISFEDTGPSHVYSAELRAASIETSSVLNWHAGVFMSSEIKSHDYAAILGEQWTSARGIPISPLEQRTTGTGTARAYAVFGQLSLDVLPRVRISLGARVEREDLSVETRTRYLYQNAPDPLPVPPFNSVELNDQTRSVDVFSPAVTLRYGIDDLTFVYSSVSRGFHGGGFNSGANRRFPSYDPEYTWNYETGIKTRLFGDRLHLNTSFFFIDWEQQQLLVVGDLSSPLQTVTNAGRSTSKGVELEIAFIPFRGVSVDFAAGLLEATLDEYRFDTQISGRDTLYDYSGNSLPGAPRFMSRTAIRYAVPIQMFGVSFLCSAVLDYQFSDPYYTSHMNVFRSSARHLLGGKVGIATDHLAFFVWTGNLLDHRYVISVFEYRGGSQAMLGPPRSTGITLRWMF